MSSDAVFSTDHQVFGREALSVNHRQGNAEGEERFSILGLEFGKIQ